MSDDADPPPSWLQIVVFLGGTVIVIVAMIALIVSLFQG